MEAAQSKSYIGKESSYEDICTEILRLSRHNIFLLYGEMGAGKTTLTKAFLKALGSDSEASSPTFSIVNEYHTPSGTVYHFDLYRLNDLDELADIGIDEYIFSGALCFIEWPQLLTEFEIDEYHKIEIEILDNSTRRINFS